MNTSIAFIKSRSGDTSSTASSYKVSVGSASSESARIPKVFSKKATVVSHNFDKAVETAVYGYIRAIRALGRKDVNTVEIAKALAIPLKQVDSAVVKLKSKGVKPR